MLHLNLPEEGAKHNGGHTAVVKGAVSVTPVDIMPQYSYSDESCEPEEHGQEFNSSDGEFVRSAREACRCQSEICDREKSPYRGEKHEVEAVGRPATPWSGVLVNDYGMLAFEVSQV